MSHLSAQRESSENESASEASSQKDVSESGESGHESGHASGSDNDDGGHGDNNTADAQATGETSSASADSSPISPTRRPITQQPSTQQRFGIPLHILCDTLDYVRTMGYRNDATVSGAAGQTLNTSTGLSLTPRTFSAISKLTNTLGAAVLQQTSGPQSNSAARAIATLGAVASNAVARTMYASAHVHGIPTDHLPAPPIPSAAFGTATTHNEEQPAQPQVADVPQGAYASSRGDAQSDAATLFPNRLLSSLAYSSLTSDIAGGPPKRPLCNFLIRSVHPFKWQHDGNEYELPAIFDWRAGGNERLRKELLQANAKICKEIPKYIKIIRPFRSFLSTSGHDWAQAPSFEQVDLFLEQLFPSTQASGANGHKRNSIEHKRMAGIRLSLTWASKLDQMLDQQPAQASAGHGSDLGQSRSEHVG